MQSLGFRLFGLHLQLNHSQSLGLQPTKVVLVEHLAGAIAA